MLKSKIAPDETLAAPALAPELLTQLKRQDMKQAIVERFSAHAEVPAPRTALRPGARSPHWQPADEEC
jgi:hypothetical protein